MTSNWNIEDHVTGMDIAPPFIAVQTVPTPKPTKIKKSIKTPR
jgi:hypothetical protein